VRLSNVGVHWLMVPAHGTCTAGAKYATVQLEAPVAGAIPLCALLLALPAGRLVLALGTVLHVTAHEREKGTEMARK
jgi:hypothetical protein